jgi:uncharacterized protein YcnI
MSIKIKVLVFISMLVLVFSTVACKQSGEAEKTVKADEAVSGAAEEVSIKVDDTVDNATEEVSIKVDDTVDNATEVLRW